MKEAYCPVCDDEYTNESDEKSIEEFGVCTFCKEEQDILDPFEYPD